MSSPFNPFSPSSSSSSSFAPLLSPPSPVKYPRRAVDRAFAVLLMRSGYDAADDLDFVPMDRFQKEFWKLRQSEYEPYLLQYSPLRVRQGDLTDPLYFDFINFAQWATISREMKDAPLVFEELQGADGGMRVVRRDPTLADNARLPQALFELVGDKVYSGLRSGFQGEVFSAPEPCSSPAPIDCVLDGVKSILRIFVQRGYALSATVSQVEQDGPSTQFQVKLQGPLTLWGTRMLLSRRTDIVNYLDAATVAAFLRASGWRVNNFGARCTDTAIDEQWVVAPAD